MQGRRRASAGTPRRRGGLARRPPALPVGSAVSVW
jgi:hypothetical protein